MILDYLEVKFILIDRIPLIDVFKQELADIGFEAFEENIFFLSSYISQIDFKQEQLDKLISKYNELFKSFELISHPYQNWNKQWESNFNPIDINSNCVIRASFHPEFNKEYELIINPEMSFGTGHHETTRLMAKELFNHDLKGKRVLDFGSGTAILSILAEKLGAHQVDAIEIDEKVNANAFKNLAANNSKLIKIINGGGESIPNKKYNFLLVNINRNTIIKEFKFFKSAMDKNSIVLFSGFLESDINYISDFAIKSGLNILYSNLENNWALLVMKFTVK